MTHMTEYETARPYLKFIERYSSAKNAATGSHFDANANVENKNIATLESEIFKGEAIKLTRLAMFDQLNIMCGPDMAYKYLDDLYWHRFYRHDETAVVGKPYCASITLYPFLLNGLHDLGGTSDPPRNLQSFCGGFINLVFAAAAQLAGAVATPEFLPYLDHYLRLEYGDDYYMQEDKVVDLSLRNRTIGKVIEDCFSQVVYSINQPAAARGNQSVFWNIAYFDHPYFDGLFEDFVFPDGDLMHWPSVSWLQKRFMKWFNRERTKKILTFPVETLNLLDNGEDCVDEEWADFAAEMWAEGHSFFCYRSDSVDSLASCCRLRNAVTENQFSYTLGAGGISTGSKCVMTININRLAQDTIEPLRQEGDNYLLDYAFKMIEQEVDEQTKRIHIYLKAFNAILTKRRQAGLLPLYDAGFVAPERQYLTVGVNGLVEAAEYMGFNISADDEHYQKFTETILNAIAKRNKEDAEEGIMFNTEFVPAENLGVKNARWDAEEGYEVPRSCYNSYFYKVEDKQCSPLDKFILHGRKFTGHLDGGSALHLNLEEHLSKEQYRQLLRVAVRTGCPYFTFNIPNTLCRDCGNISKHYLQKCPKCGSLHLDWATRVIGYLKLISSFSQARQDEAAERYYAEGATIS